MSSYVFLGLIFSSLAAIMAFLIAYGEYVHHYASKAEPLKMALKTAIFTFFAFLVLGLLGAIMLKLQNG